MILSWQDQRGRKRGDQQHLTPKVQGCVRRPDEEGGGRLPNRQSGPQKHHPKEGLLRQTAFKPRVRPEIPPRGIPQKSGRALPGTQGRTNVPTPLWGSGERRQQADNLGYEFVLWAKKW